MAHIQKSAVTLRIIGDDLIPLEITNLLGGSPTHAQTKGDRIVGKKTGQVRVARSGMWRLCASDHEPEDINGQIQDILSQLTANLTVWQSLTRKYRADLFCGLFMRGRNEGLTISSQSLVALGARGIELDLDIYAGDDGEDGAG